MFIQEGSELCHRSPELVSSNGGYLECDADMKDADGSVTGAYLLETADDNRYCWCTGNLFLFLKASGFRKVMSNGNFCPPGDVWDLSSILSKISEDSWEELLCIITFGYSFLFFSGNCPPFLPGSFRHGTLLFLLCSLRPSLQPLFLKVCG